MSGGDAEGSRDRVVGERRRLFQKGGQCLTDLRALLHRISDAVDELLSGPQGVRDDRVAEPSRPLRALRPRTSASPHRMFSPAPGTFYRIDRRVRRCHRRVDGRVRRWHRRVGCCRAWCDGLAVGIVAVVEAITVVVQTVRSAGEVLSNPTRIAGIGRFVRVGAVWREVVWRGDVLPGRSVVGGRGIAVAAETDRLTCPKMVLAQTGAIATRSRFAIERGNQPEPTRRGPTTTEPPAHEPGPSTAAQDRLRDGRCAASSA